MELLASCLPLQQVVRRIFVAAGAILFLQGPALANPSMAQQSFGLVAGRLGGLGFAYRQFLDNGMGFGVGGLPILSSNIGVEGFYTLHRSAWGRLYLVTGASVFAGFADSYSIGAGLGLDIGPPQGVGLSLEVPYTYATNQGLVMIPTVTLQYSY